MLKTKPCSKCKLEKPLTAFYRKKCASGRYSQCKVCHIAVAKRWHANNPTVCTPVILARNKAWRAANSEKVRIGQRRQHARRKYGLTLEAYDEKMKQTHCGLCGCRFGKSKTRTGRCLDHCHKTNKLRGVICHNCNMGLGCFKDSVKSLRRAITYLEAA